MTTTSTCAITAQDFSDRVTDRDRHDWTPGKMRHVIAALDGQPVAVTTDARTGHTLMGVQLVGVRRTPGYGSFDLLVKSNYADGSGRTTAYPLFSIGPVILPLGDDTSAKWTALNTAREERSAAIRVAKSRHGGQYDGGGCWGTYRATPSADNVVVSYEPSLGNPALADGSKAETFIVPLAEVEDELAAEMERREAYRLQRA